MTGAVLALHLGGHMAAVAIVLAGLLLFYRLSREAGIPTDVWIAALYVLAAGASVMLLSKAPHGESNTMNILFGNVLALGRTEILEAGALFVLIAGAIALWLHRWVWISFDSLAAEVGGIRVHRWNAVFLILFSIAMTAGIHLFGVLLAFSYLVLPTAFGLLLSKRLLRLFFWIPVLTSVSTFAGLGLSFSLDYPSGPFVAVLMAACVLLAGFLRTANLRPR